MREIKFRAWHHTSGMKYFRLPDLLHDGIPFDDGDIWSTDSPEIVLMQFTGLHDKNGREIYEGDVVRHPNGVHPVVWDDSLASWQMRFSDYVPDQEEGSISYQDVQVIGNIHENPALAGKGEG